VNTEGHRLLERNTTISTDIRLASLEVDRCVARCIHLAPASLAVRLPAVPSRLAVSARQCALPSGANCEHMRVMVDTPYSGQSLTTHDRKRRHYDLVLESDVRPMIQATLQSSESMSTPFGQQGPHSKRQRLHVSSPSMIVVAGSLFACSPTAENDRIFVEAHTPLSHIFCSARRLS